MVASQARVHVMCRVTSSSANGVESSSARSPSVRPGCVSSFLSCWAVSLSFAWRVLLDGMSVMCLEAGS